MSIAPTFRCLVHQQRRAFSVQTCSNIVRIRKVRLPPKNANKLGLAHARTRFAPSPTGYVHLGSLRTALFNYLLAKKYYGQFLLRIEDTDQSRTKEGSEKAILDVLKWANLPWDEGPEIGGSHSPYIQSKRLGYYQKEISKLLENGHAYRCFCTKERLQNIPASGYDRKCIHISPEESLQRARNQEPHVVRLKSPDQYPPFNDVVYGEVQYGDTRTVQESLVTYDDIVLIKTDGNPTYHFANVVDDHMMEISHVIRGTEWMPSTPKHVYLYNAFGWKVPTFVHLGLLQNEDGTKLSKRSGQDHVDVKWYIAQGYLPQAIINFVALLGWRNPQSSDVMDEAALINKFTLENVTRGNMIVDLGKLNFLQKAHVRALAKKGDPIKYQEFCTMVALEVSHILKNRYNIQTPWSYVQKVVDLNITRFTTYSNFVEDFDYFFVDPVAQPVEDGEPSATNYKQILELVIDLFESVDTWDGESLGQAVTASKARMLDNNPEADPVPLYAALRLALSGGKDGPSIYDIMTVLGRDRCLSRMKKF